MRRNQEPSMSRKNKAPYEPEVTIEQVCAIHPGHPETYTQSRIINSVWEAMPKLRTASAHDIAEYLNLNYRKLLATIETLTGHPFPELREAWVRCELKRLEAENPKWTADQLAQAVGFYSNSAVWRMDHRNLRAREYKAFKNYEPYISNYMQNLLEARERTLQGLRERSEPLSQENEPDNAPSEKTNGGENAN